jgi:hypothetical protein
MKDGWRMHEIDLMDAVWYFRVMAYAPRKKEAIKPQKTTTIDQILF